MSLSLSLSPLSFAAAAGIDATLEEADLNFRGDLRGEGGGAASSDDESSLSSIMMISFSFLACTTPPLSLCLRGDLRYGDDEGEE